MVDSLVVREMQARCMFNPEKIEYLKMLTNLNPKDLKNEIFNYKLPKNKLLCNLLKNYHESGFLSVRIFDVLDSYNMWMLSEQDVFDVQVLLESLPKKPFELITIHDSYRVLPNYGNDVREQYKNVLIQINNSNLLQYLIDQIVPNTVKVEKSSDLALDLEVEEYAIC